MVGVDAPDDRRHLRRGVVVGAGGVVHHGAVDAADLRRPGHDRLVGAPLRARVDRRTGHGGRREAVGFEGGAAGRGLVDDRGRRDVRLLHEPRRRHGRLRVRLPRLDHDEADVLGQAVGGAAHRDLDLVDVPDEGRLRAVAEHGRVGPDLVLRRVVGDDLLLVEDRPLRPGLGRARPQHHGRTVGCGALLPGDADHREARRLAGGRDDRAVLLGSTCLRERGVGVRGRVQRLGALVHGELRDVGLDPLTALRGLERGANGCRGGWCRRGGRGGRCRERQREYRGARHEGSK